MDIQSKIDLLGSRCYYPLPKTRPSSPGHDGLLVAIREEPSGGDFHAETMHVLLRDEDGIARWRTLRWGSLHEATEHVCPGRITLCDRSDRRVVFFSFGGTLESTLMPGEAVYELRSPAPILGITRYSDPVSAELATEVEAFMAEIEVKWGQDEEGFSRRLGESASILYCYAAIRSFPFRA